MTLTPIRRRLQLSNVSDTSLNSSAGSGMEVEFASGTHFFGFLKFQFWFETFFGAFFNF